MSSGPEPFPWGLRAVFLWLHVLPSVALVGVGISVATWYATGIFGRNTRPNAAGRDAEGQEERLTGEGGVDAREASMFRTLRIVVGILTGFSVVTGAVRAAWTVPAHDGHLTYLIIFSIKIILAITLYVLVSATVGRAPCSAALRRAGVSTSVAAVLAGAGATLCASLLASLP